MFGVREPIETAEFRRKFSGSMSEWIDEDEREVIAG